MKIPTQKLGKNGPGVSSIGYGAAAPDAGFDMETCIRTFDVAANHGMTFWDCTDDLGKAEFLAGLWFKKSGRRSEIFLATKFHALSAGLVKRERTAEGETECIQRSIRRSLERLGTEYIDLYYLNRMDPYMPVEVTMEALRDPLARGTIRWVGLGECSEETLRRAKAVPGVGEKLIAVQTEYSPLCLELDMTDLPKVADSLGVSILATYPLGRGKSKGRLRSLEEPNSFSIFYLITFCEDHDMSDRPTEKIKEIAKKYDASPARVALAWILAEHEDFIPIVECREPAFVEDYAAAIELKLDPDDLEAIREIGNEAYEIEEDGARPYSHRDCITLDEWNELHSKKE